MDTKVTDLNKIDIVAPTPRKACDSFGLSCSYCKQGAPHPLPQDLDWSSKDLDSTKAKAREQSKSLIDFNDPKPQTNMEQTTDIDKLAFSKLQIRQSDLMEEPLEVMTPLIPTTTNNRSIRRCDRKYQQRRAIKSGEKASERRRAV